METKNFLFLLLVILISSGCQSLGRRQTPAPSQPPLVVRPGVSNQELPLPTAQVPAPSTPTQIPPVGIFLSPGAMRSYAHIGVLRVLQKAHIPIVAIGGSEWGSVIAAAFAVSKSQFEVEWELMKLKADQIPTTNLIRRQITELNPNDMTPFLKAAFGDKDFDHAGVSFRCPYTDGEQTLFVSKGLVREQLSKCVALPPVYAAIDSSGHALMSAAVDPGDWAGELRRAGASFIIYVDVISRGPAFHNSVKYFDPSSTKALWTAVRTLSREQHNFANLTIEIPMDYDLTDFDRRREAVAIGEDAAKQTLSSTLKVLGMAN